MRQRGSVLLVVALVLSWSALWLVESMQVAQWQLMLSRQSLQSNKNC